jgi:hypothetical protein
MLHTARRRLVHEWAARGLERKRVMLGTTSSVLAALTGSSALVGWQSKHASSLLSAATALLGITSAMLASAMTFLNLGGRAESHVRSAAAYKSVLRQYQEDSGTGRLDDSSEAIARLAALLAEIDAAAPIVPEKRMEQIERWDPWWPCTATELVPGNNQPIRQSWPRRVWAAAMSAGG